MSSAISSSPATASRREETAGLCPQPLMRRSFTAARMRFRSGDAACSGGARKAAASAQAHRACPGARPLETDAILLLDVGRELVATRGVERIAPQQRTYTLQIVVRKLHGA